MMLKNLNILPLPMYIVKHKHSKQAYNDFILALKWFSSPCSFRDKLLWICLGGGGWLFTGDTWDIFQRPKNWTLCNGPVSIVWLLYFRPRFMWRRMTVLFYTSGEAVMQRMFGMSGLSWSPLSYRSTIQKAAPTL